MNDLTQNLTAFCRLLRQNGMPISPGDGADALRALTLLHLADRTAVYVGLRCALVKRRADYPLFDAAFRTFFDGEAPVRNDEERLRLREGEEGEPDGDVGREGGYTAAEALLQQDLALLAPADRAEATRAALRIARQLALRLARRQRVAPKGPRISLRATMRQSAGRAGMVLALVRTRRRRRPANLVLLLDVSGSMELYSRLLLQFVHALQSGLPRTRSFCFATQLCAVSHELRESSYEAAAARARRKVEGWGGGTRIGACLRDFCQDWAQGLLTQRTAVIILSDGLDTEDPVLVGQAMAEIGQRAGRVIWLNPLAGDSRYEPLARGMAAALPHIDAFRPGHSLASLLALERDLTLLHRRTGLRA